VYYYFVEPLKTLFERFGLEIIKAVKYPIHGGSLRLLIAKKETPKQSKVYAQLYDHICEDGMFTDISFPPNRMILWHNQRPTNAGFDISKTVEYGLDSFLRLPDIVP
jgi:hypothetical protein